MDKKSAQTEAKLQNLGASPAKKEDPLAKAKEAFQGALEKTKAQAADEGELDNIEDAAVIEDPKRVERREQKKLEAAKPDRSQEPNKELLELKAELAFMREQLKPKPAPEKPKATDFESVQARLAEQFGDEEGEILVGALKSLLEPREQRIANLEQLIQKAVEQSKTVSAKSNKERLAKEYGLSDEAWEIVQDQAQKRISEGKHLTADEAYEAVASALFGKTSKSAPAHNEDAEELASRISASTPTQPSSARRERKLSSEQKSRAIFDHLFKEPEDINGAKRLSRELRTGI